MFTALSDTLLTKIIVENFDLHVRAGATLAPFFEYSAYRHAGETATQ
jgi:hypothetical protein